MSRGFRVRPPWPTNPECGGKTYVSAEGPHPDPGATRGAPTERAEIHRAANPDGKENRFPQRREAGHVLLPTDPDHGGAAGEPHRGGSAAAAGAGAGGRPAGP